MRSTVRQWMERSGVGFGTSGARGLAVALTDQVSYASTRGFLGYLESSQQWVGRGGRVAVAGDLRPSTRRLMRAIQWAIRDAGSEAVMCGLVPSPALALYGIEQGIPSIMVTGSHIPADRNGIKFNKPAGEILKSDEPGILAQEVECPDGRFTAAGGLVLAEAEA